YFHNARPHECLALSLHDALPILELVQARELGRADAHRVRLKNQPHARLTDEAVDLFHHFVEPGHGAQRLQCGAVGGVLPGHRRDLGEDLAWARGRQGGLSHMMLLTRDRSPLRQLTYFGFRDGRGAACCAPALTRAVTRRPPVPVLGPRSSLRPPRSLPTAAPDYR